MWERLDPAQMIRLHSYEECVADKRAFGKNFTRIETLSNLMAPDETLVEGVGDRYGSSRRPTRRLRPRSWIIRSICRTSGHRTPPLPIVATFRPGR